MSKGRIQITDHAMIRYLQRVKGLDVRALQDEILPKDLRKKLIKLEGVFSINGHHVRLKDRTVITVYKDF